MNTAAQVVIHWRWSFRVTTARAWMHVVSHVLLGVLCLRGEKTSARRAKRKLGKSVKRNSFRRHQTQVIIKDVLNSTAMGFSGFQNNDGGAFFTFYRTHDSNRLSFIWGFCYQSRAFPTTIVATSSYAFNCTAKCTVIRTSSCREDCC